MRFLVDLYRWLILLTLAAALIGGSWLGFWLAAGPLSSTPQGWLFLSTLVGVGIALVLGVGITAIFISIHDRIADMADSMRRIAAAQERGQPHYAERTAL